MPFRGYFALNGVEIANSSRAAAHIGATVPTSDLGLFSPAGDCSMTPLEPGSLLAELASSQSVMPGSTLLATVPDGSRLYSSGLAVVGDCWSPSNLCFECRDKVGYDDSWEGLPAHLGDNIYRPELSPWYSTRVPESGEFGGIWVLNVTGLDSTPSERTITEMAGNGGAAGPHRDTSREVTFDALLIACTNAGLTHGLQWLNYRLRETKDRTDSVLRYLAAHPEHSAVDPASLVREVHGVVMTQEARVTDSINTGRGQHHQATMYRVQWKLTVTRPYSYSPAIPVDVLWDTITVEPISWVHAADCVKPASCDPMPVLFSTECEVDPIEIVSTPPPNCGGCLPVCAVESRVFQVPTFDWPIRSRETAVSIGITNTGAHGLTLQCYWRRCNSRDVCEDNRFPIQVSGLPTHAELVLDGISARYWVNYAGRKRRPAHIVSTPSGAPWQPPIIDRADCWELVIQAAAADNFEVTMSLADREA